MTICMQTTEKILISLEEGKVLFVTGKTNTSGTIYKTPDGSTTNATRTWAVSSNSTQAIGPYESVTQFIFACESGQIEILKKDATLASPFYAFDSNGAVIGLVAPDNSIIPLTAPVNRTATAGAALSAGQLVYMKSDGMLAPADATVEGKEAVGFIKNNYAQGASATYHKIGDILTGLTGLTPGATYYMSTTPGALATASDVSAYVAGNVVMPVGRALSATELLFSPNSPITL